MDPPAGLDIDYRRGVVIMINDQAPYHTHIVQYAQRHEMINPHGKTIFRWRGLSVFPRTRALSNVSAVSVNHAALAADESERRPVARKGPSFPAALGGPADGDTFPSPRRWTSPRRRLSMIACLRSSVMVMPFGFPVRVRGAPLGYISIGTRGKIAERKSGNTGTSSTAFGPPSRLWPKTR